MKIILRNERKALPNVTFAAEIIRNEVFTHFLIEKSRFYLKILQESWQLLQKKSRKLSLTNWV